MIERRTLAQNQHAHWIRHVIQFSQSVNAQGRITNIVNILTNAISFAPKIALALIQIVDAMIMVRASITVIKWHLSTKTQSRLRNSHSNHSVLFQCMQCPAESTSDSIYPDCKPNLITDATFDPLFNEFKMCHPGSSGKYPNCTCENGNGSIHQFYSLLCWVQVFRRNS